MQVLSIFSDATKRQRELNEQLFRAINDEYWPGVEKLLAEGASPDAWQQSNPLNALHTAVHFNASERVTRILLEKGANIQSQSIGDAFTPLHRAARMDKRAHIRTLVEFKADMTARDGKGNTPLHTAIVSGNLFAAAQLINLGASMTITNNDGHTPLQLEQAKDKSIKGYEELMSAVSRRHARMFQHAHQGRPKGP